MTAEELYKKEFGDLEYIPKESVIRLLRNFAAVLKIERQNPTHKPNYSDEPTKKIKK